MACSIRVAPRPPYSLGHANPSHPAAPSRSCHLREQATACRWGNASSRSTVHSGGRFCPIQFLTSSRKACSLGERFRSKVEFLLRAQRSAATKLAAAKELNNRLESSACFDPLASFPRPRL